MRETFEIMQAQWIKGFLLLFLLPAFSFSDADAQEFRFEFKNPGFGGNPNNYYYFMNSAEEQKPDFSAEEEDRFSRSALDDFERTMQRQVLSQLSRDLTRGDNQIDFTKDGTYDLGDFLITVSSELDIVNIEIEDLVSGERTQVEIPRF